MTPGRQDARTRQEQEERETAVIRAPHDGSEVGVVALAGPEDLRAALDANVATEEMTEQRVLTLKLE